MNWARHERQELADLLTAVGPDAPTLDEGWTTSDLAAHLVIRDRRPDAAVGLVVRAPRGARREGAPAGARAAVARPRGAGSLRAAPLVTGRLEAVDRVTNTVEFYVHHEDVRRAQDGWEPRPADGDLEHELWRRLKPMARLLTRKAPVGLVLRRSNGDEIVAKKPGDDRHDGDGQRTGVGAAPVRLRPPDHARSTSPPPTTMPPRSWPPASASSPRRRCRRRCRAPLPSARPPPRPARRGRPTRGAGPG